MAKEISLEDFGFDEKAMLGAIADDNTKKFWRPEKDRTTLRILPPIAQNGEKLFYSNHRVHWVNRMPYECLNQTTLDKDGNLHQAEPCPICKLAKTLYKMGDSDPESLELAKQISAKSKAVVRIILRGEDESKVYFYELPYKVHQYLISNISSGEWGSVVHPIKGRDFTLQRSGKGMFTDYSSSSLSPNITPISKDKESMLLILKEAMGKTYNSLITFQTPDALKAVVNEMVNPPKTPTSGYKPMQHSAPKQAHAPKQTHAPKADPVEEMMGDEEFELPEVEDDENSELNKLLGDFGISGDDQISF